MSEVANFVWICFLGGAAVTLGSVAFLLGISPFLLVLYRVNTGKWLPTREEQER